MFPISGIVFPIFGIIFRISGMRFPMPQGCLSLCRFPCTERTCVRTNALQAHVYARTYARARYFVRIIPGVRN